MPASVYLSPATWSVPKPNRQAPGPHGAIALNSILILSKQHLSETTPTVLVSLHCALRGTHLQPETAPSVQYFPHRRQHGSDPSLRLAPCGPSSGSEGVISAPSKERYRRWNTASGWRCGRPLTNAISTRGVPFEFYTGGQYRRLPAASVIRTNRDEVRLRFLRDMILSPLWLIPLARRCPDYG